jgi:hypothetical protein
LRAVGCAESVAPSRPLRLAYADPPYPGKARLYRDHPDYGGEVDHAVLIGRLGAYDGWALSTSAGALPAMLALCPAGVRVAAWHRGERPTPSRWPLHAWEPVIYHGGRQLITGGHRRADSLVCGVGPLDTLPGRVIGAKPAAVCRWIFTLLGAAPGDTLDDLFPRSGAVSRAWAAYTFARGLASRLSVVSGPARRVVVGHERRFVPVVWDLTRRLSAAVGRAGHLPARLSSLCAAPSPIGLTAADLFARAEASRIDSRVR